MNPESKKVAILSNDEGRQSRLAAAEQVMQTFMKQLPGELTAAYSEACRLAPKVVAKESNACWFLNFHESDPVTAVRRLANYWKKRKEIFAERAFLPINLTGNGAMTADDVRLLQTGYTINLPRDEKNRSILYTDMSKKPPDTVPSPRVVFFFCQSIMENNKASHSQYGHILLYNISNPFASSFETENVKCMQLLLQHCMPVGKPLVYFIYIPVGGAIIHQSFIDTVYTFGMNRIGSCFDEQSKHSLIASSKEDCLSHLMKCGLAADRLPVSLGGSWAGGCEPWRSKGHDDDGDHDEMRLEIESDLACLIRNALWCYNQTVAKEQQQYASSSLAAPVAAPTVLSSSASLPHIRPARGSRRRRRRHRQTAVTEANEESSEENRKMPAIPYNDMQEDDDEEEIAASVDRNRCCSDESSKIPVAAAAAAAAGSSRQEQQSPTQARIALRRKRDIVYAKRKRERKKIEIEVLRQESNRLSASNEALRSEGARLDELLRVAQQQVMKHNAHHANDQEE